MDTLCIVAHIFDGNFHAMIPTKEEEVDKIEEFSDRLANIVLDAGGEYSNQPQFVYGNRASLISSSIVALVIVP